MYAQILKDLQDAEKDLPAHYDAGKNERVRANKWAAKALLAKVHLFMGNYPQAAAKASELIAATNYFYTGTTRQYLPGAKQEAIFQLKQTNMGTNIRNATAHLGITLFRQTLTKTLPVFG